MVNTMAESGSRNGIAGKSNLREQMPLLLTFTKRIEYENTEGSTQVDDPGDSGVSKEENQTSPIWKSARSLAQFLHLDGSKLCPTLRGARQHDRSHKEELPGGIGKTACPNLKISGL